MDKMYKEIQSERQDDLDDDDASTADNARNREMDREKRRKRGNVRTITVAARKRLIKWHLAQRASAPRSWWRRERMGFDSRERRWEGGSGSCRGEGAGMQRGEACRGWKRGRRAGMLNTARETRDVSLGEKEGMGERMG